MKLLTSLLVLACAVAAHARQPNIVFILADDLGPGDLGCYGQKIIRTPNIDRIAAEGMKFTQHYCGNAVCAPSRCVLMSGLHPGHAFIRDNRQADDAKGLPKMGKPEHEGQFPIPDSTVIIPELLKSAGYTTGGFGKWGLGGPTSTGAPLKQGFDRWFGYNCQGVAHNFYPTYLWDNDKTIDLKNPPFLSNDKLKPDEDPTKPESYQRFQGTEYSADLIAEQALKFARDNKDRPFFLYWPTTVPHVALQVPDDSLQEYLGQFDDPPYPGGKGYLPHFKPKAAYAAMITRMDREIGRMMALIAELGLDDDTIFVFVSDNGPLNGTHQGLAGTDCAFFNSNEGRRDGKGTVYDGGIRSPCVVRWKGKIKAGTTSDRITGFEDWMPTLLDLAGARDQTPARTDGISFAPTLLGQEQPPREFLYREFHGYGGQQVLRMGDWKLVRRGLSARGAKAKAKATAPTEELFNLATDPAETTDLAAANPDRVAQMKAIMAKQHANSTDFALPALDQ
ncbi:MAG: arylsulfatase [Prosthecobacter sp.]|jgi:arylsulfatase A|uniref:arylsulfatase n=1 Tax=Prosthecobacter sp. TaxID=1965333 RepID=UPI0019EAAE4B|nr:arylsulfatase [Prosthecobacter sp.]MBE2287697.1 arylsulfatase [Prosthecobacter sp.]